MGPISNIGPKTSRAARDRPEHNPRRIQSSRHHRSIAGRRPPPRKSRGGSRTASRQARRTAARNVACPAGERRPVVAPASGATVHKSIGLRRTSPEARRPTSGRDARPARTSSASSSAQPRAIIGRPCATTARKATATNRSAVRNECVGYRADACALARACAWLRPVSRGNRHFTVGGGRLRQSGPRPEERLLRQPALEGLTRSARTDSPRQVGRNKFRRGGGGGGGFEERREAAAFDARADFITRNIAMSKLKAVKYAQFVPSTAEIYLKRFSQRHDTNNRSKSASSRYQIHGRDSLELKSVPAPEGHGVKPQYEELHNIAIKYRMKCIMSCKCMSGTKIISNNRKAKQTITTTVTHHRASGATRSHPVENRVAHRQHTRGGYPPGRMELLVGTTIHSPTSMQVTATEGYESVSPHPSAALNRDYATQHRITREGFNRITYHDYQRNHWLNMLCRCSNMLNMMHWLKYLNRFLQAQQNTINTTKFLLASVLTAEDFKKLKSVQERYSTLIQSSKREERLPRSSKLAEEQRDQISQKYSNEQQIHAFLLKSFHSLKRVAIERSKQGEFSATKIVPNGSGK
ncbi:hypothetical protein F511_25455 [Dorcoceras hygrometricum]|uniref:Uncharacterized protein n=1 Tax=Dorcoceras hygrometricum TaxID=472368 RepID=A0A2Z7CXZ2_9LAMI|nr:hypothetical protein F511_25455 [Dorcoceras hygrometricum]